jgi:Tfp pilus assembly protein PilF
MANLTAILQVLFYGEGARRSRYDLDMIRNPKHGFLSLLLLSIVAPCLAQQAPNDAPQQAAIHLREAHRLLSENKPEAAIPELKAAVALDPSSIDARANLGVLLFFQAKYTEAIPDLREALRLKPDLSKIQALLGMAERRTGDAVSARADLEASFPALVDTKVRIEAGLELIEIYAATEDLDKSSAVIAVLRGLDPENPALIYAAYRIHADLAREAILSLTMVAPKSALMYQVMAHEAARRGETPTAIREYREAIKINPKQPGLHFELAEMLRTLPSTPATTAEAKAEYQAALAQNPFDEKAEVSLAKMTEESSDPKKAYDLYARALKLQPDDAEANYELGKLSMAMDRPSDAQKLLEHAVQIDPTNAVIHFRLSTVYKKLGRVEDAKREVEQYRKYQDLKDKLRDTYRELHLDPGKLDKDETPSNP